MAQKNRASLRSGDVESLLNALNSGASALAAQAEEVKRITARLQSDELISGNATTDYKTQLNNVIAGCNMTVAQCQNLKEGFNKIAEQTGMAMSTVRKSLSEANADLANSVEKIKTANQATA